MPLDIQGNKQKIFDLLYNTERDGMEKLYKWLEESDFFTAPASRKFHLNEPGGLAQHSLNVYEILVRKFYQYQDQLTNAVNPCIWPGSITIVSLLHDLCKVGFYKEGGDPCSDAQFNYYKGMAAKNINRIKQIPELSHLILADGALNREIPTEHASLLIDWLKGDCWGRPAPVLPIVYAETDELPLGHGETSLYRVQQFIKLTDDEALAIRWHMGAWDISDYYGKNAFGKAQDRPLVILLQTADTEATRILEATTDGTEKA